MSNHGSVDATFTYHLEDGVWWSESDDWPGFTAAADSREELTKRIQDVIDIERPGLRWSWTTAPPLAEPQETPP